MPIITISRGSFAGGKAVAEAVAQKLGFSPLSREQALEQAARDYGIEESELTRAFEESPSYWQQLPGKRLAYTKCVSAVLLEHVRGGNLIYHGQVGHLLLAAVPHVLKVRVIADHETRVRSAMAQANLSRDGAVSYIQRKDGERARWSRLMYGVEWEDPLQYDIVLNLGRLSAAAASAAIVRMAEQPEFQPTADSLRNLEDLLLSHRVWGALARNPHARSAGIQVTAHDGEVVITGSVGSGKVADVIPRIAQGVQGVKSVRCEVGVGTDWYW